MHEFQVIYADKFSLEEVEQSMHSEHTVTSSKENSVERRKKESLYSGGPARPLCREVKTNPTVISHGHRMQPWGDARTAAVCRYDLPPNLVMIITSDKFQLRGILQNT